MQNKENVTWIDKMGYGIGAGVISFLTIAMQYHTLYLTNVVFLDIAVISGIMAVSRIFDGISDILIGGLIDNTESVHGKARIWILRMCLPMSVSMILMFFVPASFPEAMKYVYVFVIYNLFGTIFLTFLSVAHGSLVCFLTADPAEHRHIISIAGLVSKVFGMIVSYLFVKLLLVFTSEPGNHLTQRSFTCVVSIIAVCSTIMSVLEFLLTKERVHTDTAKQEADTRSISKLLSEIKLLITDKYWLILFISSVVGPLSAGAMGGSMSYYCLYIMKDIEVMALFNLVNGISGIIASFLLVLIGRKVATTKLVIICALIHSVARVGIAFTGANRTLLLAFIALSGMGAAAMTISITAMIPLIVTYSQKKNGRMVPGVGNAFAAAARKLGMGGATVIVGFIMSMAGFNARLDAQGIAQPQSVLDGIQICFCWFPAIATMFAAGILALFCDVEKKMKEMDV